MNCPQCPAIKRFQSFCLQYQLSKNADVDAKKKMEEKILSILSDPKATFDPDHALILSQMHGFSRGTLFLYEKKGLHDQVQFAKVFYLDKVTNRQISKST